MVEFRLSPDGESIDWPNDEEEAERERVVKECAERDGHEWELELEHPEEGGIALHCARCPAGVDDVYVDGHEFIYLEFDGITVEDGKHDSLVPLVVPVSVNVAFGSRWTDYGMEHEAELIVAQRGPARPGEVTS